MCGNISDSRLTSYPGLVPRLNLAAVEIPTAARLSLDLPGYEVSSRYEP